MQAPVERSEQQPWVQVIGQIAVRRPGREPHVLTGATRVLLAILVAAGPQGIAVEEIARAYWRTERPRSWRIALRVSASHLSTKLPDGWQVSTDDTQFRLLPADGFVDAWQIQDDQHAQRDCAAPNVWPTRGRPFDDITGIELIDLASERIAELMPDGAAESRGKQFADHAPLAIELRSMLVSRLRSTRRLIIAAAPEHHREIVDLALEGDDVEGHLVIGDRGLLMPLGPFTMAFPELRNEVWVEQGVVEHGSAAHAFRIVADALARLSAQHGQRLVISRAHELDTKSLTLASLLIDRAPQTDGSLVLIADFGHRDLRWLDFVRRSTTAGCDLVEIPD